MAARAGAGQVGGPVVSTAAGVVALFRPIALRIARRTSAAPISGMMTPGATAPNLVVNSEFAHHGEAGCHFSSLTPLEKD